MVSSLLLEDKKKGGEWEKRGKAPWPGREIRAVATPAGPARPCGLLRYYPCQCLLPATSVFVQCAIKKKKLGRGGLGWRREEGERRGLGGGKQEGSCEPVWG